MKTVLEKKAVTRSAHLALPRPLLASSTSWPATPGCSPRTAPSRPSESSDTVDDRSDAVLHTQVAWGLGILAGIVVASAVMAGALLGRDELLFGTFLFSLYLTLFGMPFWIAAIHTEGDETKRQLMRLRDTPR
jgi:hypothetical protein